jgi:hypothetical protein
MQQGLWLGFAPPFETQLVLSLKSRRAVSAMPSLSFCSKYLKA